METETKTPAPVLHKKTFKNKNNKRSEKKPTDGKNGAGKGTLTSQLLDAAAANLASATPEERAARLAKAKARREKKQKKNKAASGEKSKKSKTEKETKTPAPAATPEIPAVPLSQEMKAKMEQQKAKRME